MRTSSVESSCDAGSKQSDRQPRYEKGRKNQLVEVVTGRRSLARVLSRSKNGAEIQGRLGSVKAS